MNFAEPKNRAGRRGLDIQKPTDALESDLIWPGEDYFVRQDRMRRHAAKLGIEFKGFGFHTKRRTYASVIWPALP